MSTTSYFINKSNFVNNKYIKAMNSILRDYENKKIKTQTEYMYCVGLATKSFVEDLNSPIFKLHLAKSTPISSDFEEMVNNAIDDINILFNEAIYVGENLNSINVEMNSYLSIFNNASSQLGKEISFLSDNVKSIESNRCYIFSDSFNDNSNVIIKNNTGLCRMDYTNGHISLNTTIEKDYSTSLLVEVLDDSNGFPGNTHEVEVLDNSICFVGDKSSYIDIYNITDGNDKTWFEYEFYKIPDDTYLNCNGYGFAYKEGISWLSDESKLTLSLKFKFEDLKMCNWITLSPFFDSSKNNKAPIIKKVIVTDCAFNTQEIKIQKEFNDSIIVSFEPQDVKEIIVHIEQNYGYNADIGHFYSLKIDKNINIYESIHKNNYRRLNIYNPSIEVIGMKYDPNEKKYKQPGYRGSQRNFLNENIIKKELFTIPYSSDESIYNDIEILKAFRYSIGVKSISVCNFVFNESSYYITKDFKTKENIVSIELEANDYIPSSFSEGLTAAEYNPSDYLKYEISFDSGDLWYEIYPRHRVQYGPCRYDINSDVLPSMRSTKTVRYINRLLDTNKVCVRITMNRRDGYIYDSPIVYNYKLNIIVEEDNYENF